MYISRKKSTEEIPNELTTIWSCTKDDCNGWMRDGFSFEEFPICPQCHSSMIRSEKSLPVLLDSGYGLKR
ncbi:cold-shock protein [Paenibacillus sp. 1P07SE]|uniref:cold-shock protein n=1 Tax=Paenibacillus sp. 1P07SE TaxID=3132209 RepID=UPI0039A553DB